MRLPLLALTAVLALTGCTDDVPVSPPVPPPSIPAVVTPAASPPSGSRVEPTPYAVPTSPATVAVTEVPRDTLTDSLPAGIESLTWTLVRLYDGGQTLALRYSPGCADDAGRAQVEKTGDYVEVKVVHPVQNGGDACLRTYTHSLRLRSPLGDRALVHGPTGRR
jgi:hypothetical protein